MKLKIKTVKAKSFQSDDGSEIKYFWYVAQDMSDGMIKRFGSTVGTHKIGEVCDLDLEADVSSQGKSILKEFVEPSASSSL